MADEPNLTPAPTPPPQQMGNSPEARNPDGSLKTNPAPTPEPKPDTSTAKAPDAKAEDKTGDKKADAKPPVVPEKYELKAPEGHEVDAKVIEEVTPIFKELNLTNDQAQKLVDVWNKHSIEAAEAPFKAYETMRDGWRGEIAKDPTLGDGKDSLKPEVRANIAKAYDAIGDNKIVDAFKAAMDLTGAGDNPAFVRAMNAWGKLLSEGTAVRGAGPAKTGQAAPGAVRSAAQALYPNNPSAAS